jgi:hypothetical protein
VCRFITRQTDFSLGVVMMMVMMLVVVLPRRERRAGNDQKHEGDKNELLHAQKISTDLVPICVLETTRIKSDTVQNGTVTHSLS